MKNNDLEWVRENNRRRALLADVQTKPRMLAETTSLLGLKKTERASKLYKQTGKRHLTRQLAPRLYTLTFQGKAVRRRLLSEQGRLYSYIQPKLDWTAYSWIMLGGCRRIVLMLLQRFPNIAVPRLRRLLKTEERTRMRRETLFETLKDMLQKGIAQVSSENPSRHYELSAMGRKTRQQILAVWFVLFVFA